MTDQNRKTLRSFYCRDYLYDLFEQMAQELGCSMDYLINESMRLYARSRDYSVAPEQDNGYGGAPQGPGGFGGGAPMHGGGRGAQPQGGFGYDAPAPAGPPAMDPRAAYDRAPAAAPVQGRGPGPGHAPGPGQGAGPAPGYAPRGPAGGPPPPPPRPAPAPPSTGGWQQAPQRGPGGPPPSPGGFGAEPAGYGAAARQPLYLTFNNNRYIVDKDKFVIGRGSQDTDLTIRDGNISRKHCAVIFRNGAYFIKDLESTNGIEFRGTRIESKKIDEGDVFYLCDYELRFSYRG